MNTYAELQYHILRGRDKTCRKIANNTTARLEGDNVVIRLHYTDICIIYPDNSRQFFAKNWHTNTTKERINSLLLWPYRVFQENYIWYVYDLRHHNKIVYFTDGMVITSDNFLLHAKML